MLFEGASEGLDVLSVRPGLGVVEGAVDVHASQWGTLGVKPAAMGQQASPSPPTGG